jgi:hypothetical protein
VIQALALTALLGAAGPGPGPDPGRDAGEVPLFRVYEESWSFGMTAAAQGRLVVPFGSLEDGFVTIYGNTIIVEDHLQYADLFDIGVGATFEADLLFHPKYHPGTPTFAQMPTMGAYVAVEYDHFGGDQEELDNDVWIEPEDLNLTSLFVGFKARGVVEGSLFGDLRMGLGAVLYPSVEADFRRPGLPAYRGELFEESRGFAWEFRMHFGWRAGPFAFVFGFGSRLMDGPDAGRAVELDPGWIWTLEGEIGVEVGF